MGEWLSNKNTDPTIINIILTALKNWIEHQEKELPSMDTSTQQAFEEQEQNWLGKPSDRRCI